MLAPELPRAAAWFAPALVLILAFAAAPAARADEVILSDGAIVRGEVLADPADGPVRVALARGDDQAIVEIPRAQVRAVRRLDDAEERLVVGAEEALLAGEHARAVELLLKLVERRPEDARAHRELGFALVLGGRPDAALAPLERACDLDPIDFEVWLACAQTLQRLGRRDEAIERFRRAARLGPRHTVAWRALAQLLQERAAERAAAQQTDAAASDRREALETLERAGREDPRDEDVAIEHAAALVAGEDEAEHARARELLTAFAARVPEATRVPRFLARLEAASGAHAEAAARAQALLAREGLPDALREALAAEAALYGWLAAGAPGFAPRDLDAGEPACDPARAARQLRGLLELLPEDGRLQLALGRALLRAGEHELGRRWLERAALAGPRPVVADALLLQQAAAALQAAPAGEPVATLFGPTVAVTQAHRLVALAPWWLASHRTLTRALRREERFAEEAAAHRAALPWASEAERAALEAAAREAEELARGDG